MLPVQIGGVLHNWASVAHNMVTFPRTEPYNQLPPLPPLVDMETKPVLKAAIRANRMLADLKGTGRLVPNQAVLLRSIVLQEARVSSAIENIVTTNDDLYMAMSADPAKADPHTKEVLRYSDAVWHGYWHLQHGGKLDRSLFCEIASLLKNQPMDVRANEGTRLGNTSTGETFYTPPVGTARLEALLDNLSDYIAREDDVEPLVKLAAIHYQFEAIHPFHDGNGRTGRVLMILYLIQQGLLESPVLYLSRYILENRAKYYDGLRRVTEEAAWEDWALFILDGIEQTAAATRVRFLEIEEALADAITLARERVPKIYSKELVELIFEQPYTRIGMLELRGIAKRQTASVYLQSLEEIGLLTGQKVGRDMIYVNPRLLAILTS